MGGYTMVAEISTIYVVFHCIDKLKNKEGSKEKMINNKPQKLASGFFFALCI